MPVCPKWVFLAPRVTLSRRLDHWRIPQAAQDATGQALDAATPTELGQPGCRRTSADAVTLGNGGPMLSVHALTSSPGGRIGDEHQRWCSQVWFEPKAERTEPPDWDVIAMAAAERTGTTPSPGSADQGSADQDSADQDSAAYG